jgi:outer membrane receptor protein involved in Fe transport
MHEYLPKRRVIAAAVMALVARAPALAQGVPPGDAVPAAQAGAGPTVLPDAVPVAAPARVLPEPAPPVSDAASNRVVVSASRIARGGFTAPTPTTIVGAEELQSKGATNVAALVFELPSVAPTSSGGVASANSGGNFINLRGLGQSRTLVLVNGRRHVPTTITGVVDANVIPSSLVDRIEVVTGGASAAWGSDAVAGVMNFILKKKIEGFTANVQYGTSAHRDNDTRSASVGWGKSFAGDRGEFMIAGEFNDLSDVAKQGSRDWGRQHWAIVSGSVNGGPNYTRNIVSGAQLSGLTTGGTIVPASGGALPVGNPLRGIQFGPGGTILPFNYGTNVGAQVALGGSGGWVADDQALSPPQRRKNVFMRTTYRMDNNVRGFVEASYVENETRIYNLHAMTPGGSDLPLLISVNNPYLPSAVRDIMTSASPGIRSFHLARINDEFGSNLNVTSNKTGRLVLGADGDFGETGKWNAYVTTGRNRYEAAIHGMINEVNFRSAVDVIAGPNGTPICNPATVALLGADPGCVPANPFGPGSLTEAVRDYATGTMDTVAVMKEHSVGASVQGEPFSIWAGPVSLAGGGEFRRQKLKQYADSNSVRRAPAVTGVTAALDGVWQYGNPKPIDGGVDVKEAFVEAIAPLAAKTTGIESLDATVAARIADYSTSGKVSSWKGGLTYKPVKGLLLRGTRSRDIRAPNLNELYAAGAQTVTNIVDPVLGLTYSARQVAVGNPNLNPEIGDTTVVGFSVTPASLRGFSASLDYYDIKLKEAIATINAVAIVNGCYGVNGATSTPAYCNFINRDPVSGRVSAIFPQAVNLAAISTRGFDVEVSYRTPVASLLGAGAGDLNFRFLGTYLKNYITNDGTTSIERAGDQTGGAKVKWNLTTGYRNGAWLATVTGRYIGRSQVDNTYTQALDISDNNVPSRFYLNASAEYTLYDSPEKGRASLFFKVDNLLDKDPPIITGTSNQPSATNTNYDRIGRAFAVGMRLTYR